MLVVVISPHNQFISLWADFILDGRKNIYILSKFMMNLSTLYCYCFTWWIMIIIIITATSSGQRNLTKDCTDILSPLTAVNGFIQPWPSLRRSSLWISPQRASCSVHRLLWGSSLCPMHIHIPSVAIGRIYAVHESGLMMIRLVIIITTSTCVLSNSGPSNATSKRPKFVEKRGNYCRDTAKIGICTALKSDIYFLFVTGTIVD